MQACHKKIHIYFKAIFLLLLLSGCTPPGGTDGSTVSANNTINGGVFAGAMDKAKVEVFLVENSTVSLKPSFSTQTDSDGQFSVSVGDYSGPVVLKVTGGSYIDESTGNLVTNTTTLRAMAPGIKGFITISPLTELAARLANVQAGKALSVADMNLHNDTVAVYFSGQSTEKVNIIHTVPAIPDKVFSANTQVDEKNYGFLLAMFSQFDVDISTALNTIEASVSSNGLSTTVAQSLASALTAFLNGSFNKTNISSSPLVSIVLNKGNTSPDLQGSTFNLTVNTLLTQQLLASDPDAGTNLVYSVSGTPLANFSIDTSGQFTYMPQTIGNHIVDVQVDDGSGAANAITVATLVFNVVSGNAAPVASDISISPFFNTPVNGQLSATDTNGDAVTYTLQNQPSKGVITAFNAQTGAFTYSPTVCTGTNVAPGSSQCSDNGAGTPVITAGAGTTSFTYTATDGTDVSQPATVNITIIGDKTIGQTLYNGDNQSNISCGNASCHGPFVNANPIYRIYKRGTNLPAPPLHPLTSSPDFSNILEEFSQPLLAFIVPVGNLVLDDGTVLSFGHADIANGSPYVATNYLSQTNLSHIAAYMCSVNTTGVPGVWSSQVSGSGSESYYDVTFSCSLNDQ